MFRIYFVRNRYCSPIKWGTNGCTRNLFLMFLLNEEISWGDLQLNGLDLWFGFCIKYQATHNTVQFYFGYIYRLRYFVLTTSTPVRLEEIRSECGFHDQVRSLQLLLMNIILLIHIILTIDRSHFRKRITADSSCESLRDEKIFHIRKFSTNGYSGCILYFCENSFNIQ